MPRELLRQHHTPPSRVVAQEWESPEASLRAGGTGTRIGVARELDAPTVDGTVLVECAGVERTEGELNHVVRAGEGNPAHRRTGEGHHEMGRGALR